MYVKHNKPNWDKLQAISVLTSDSPKLGPALKKNPFTFKCLDVTQNHEILQELLYPFWTTYQLYSVHMIWNSSSFQNCRQWYVALRMARRFCARTTRKRTFQKYWKLSLLTFQSESVLSVELCWKGFTWWMVPDIVHWLCTILVGNGGFFSVM